MEEELREWLTPRDFRERYKLSTSTLSELARQGRVDVLDLGGRIRRYRVKLSAFHGWEEGTC